MTKAEIIRDMTETKAAIAAVTSDLAYYGSRSCVAVVRLSDRLWDLQARELMLCKMVDAMVPA